MYNLVVDVVVSAIENFDQTFPNSICDQKIMARNSGMVSDHYVVCALLKTHLRVSNLLDHIHLFPWEITISPG